MDLTEFYCEQICRDWPCRKIKL